MGRRRLSNMIGFGTRFIHRLPATGFQLPSNHFLIRHSLRDPTFISNPSKPAAASLSLFRMSEKQKQPSEKMSKLSPSLKALINAPFARPGPRAAPAQIADVYQAIAREAAQKNLGQRPWLAVSV